MALTPTERKIKSCLERLRRQIYSGDDSEILCWVIPGALACSQRPLRDHPVYGGPDPPPLPPEACPLVEEWTQRVLDSGICSVICLLELAQLDKHYVHGGLGLPGGGLLEYYKRRGLEVRHQPTTDYQRPSEELMENVLSDFDELTPPVLLHCSAAIDRTVPVAAFLVEQRGNSEDAA